MSHDLPFRWELETTAPTAAPGGRLHLKGWCVISDQPQTPHVRLVVGDRAFSATSEARPDVLVSLGLPGALAACGFTINARLAPGVHLARLEASLDRDTWHELRTLCLGATEEPLQGEIEFPPSARITESARIQGWCAHPHRQLVSVALHYGNRRIACQFGLPRSDVPGFLPGAPDAPRAGFISVKNLPVGHGPLRLAATDSAGGVHFLDTGRLIDIPTDEENPTPLDLSGPAAGLSPLRRAATSVPAPRTAAPRRILFVLYGDMTSNSAIHVAALADELIARGHECIVAVPRDPDTIRYHHGASFRCVAFAECGERAALFTGGAAPEIVHAWTTSECVRRFALGLVDRTGARLLVHLEDHEGAILEAATGRSGAELAALPAGELERLVGDDFSHPVLRDALLARAEGCTLILDRLRELLPPGKPAQVIWPAAAPEFFARPMPWALREALGWGRAHTVLFYHGNLHPANRAELAELYEAVVALNAAGLPTTLLRAGRDFCPLPATLAERSAPHVVALGRIDQHRHLAPLLALADFFVQPGEPDSFNNYRFPSKLPEFFASGRPVILPRTNLGAVVHHGEDAFVLDRADAAGIAAAVRTLRAEPALAERLAAGAAAFAAARFSWVLSTDRLEAFYDGVLTARR